MYAARDISFFIGSKAILDSASVEVAPGKVVAIVGPNGAGKSTLLKVLAGEQRAGFAGSVMLDGTDLQSWDAVSLARKRAVLPQSVVVAFPFLSREIVALGLPQYFSRAEGGKLNFYESLSSGGRHGFVNAHLALPAVALNLGKHSF